MTAFLETGTFNPQTKDLEWRFNEMVLRNFLYGAALGIAFWFTLKFILSVRRP